MNSNVDMMMVQQASKKAISQAQGLLSRLDRARDLREVVHVLREQSTVGSGPFRPIIANDVRPMLRQLNLSAEEKALDLVGRELEKIKLEGETELRGYIASAMRLSQGYLPRVCMALQRAMQGNYDDFNRR